MTVNNDIKIERHAIMKQTAAKQYAKIRPFLPVQRGNVRIPNIAIINAVLYVLENGCKWRALPGVWFIFLGQAAAARQALQSRKSAQRLFSRQHLTASRALAPAFDQLSMPK